MSTKKKTDVEQVKKTEGKIQQEIVMWFNNSFCLVNHNPRGIIFSVPNESRNQDETMYKKRLGLLGGVSDLILCKPCGEIVFTEVKAEDGKQSKKQVEFQERVTALGYRYILARSLEEFKSKI